MAGGRGGTWRVRGSSLRSPCNGSSGLETCAEALRRLGSRRSGAALVHAGLLEQWGYCIIDMPG